MSVIAEIFEDQRIMVILRGLSRTEQSSWPSGPGGWVST